MGRFLACKNLFKQGLMCVTFVMSCENFLGKFLTRIIKRGIDHGLCV